MAAFLDVPVEAFNSDKPKENVLAAKMLESLPIDIVKAIGDVRLIEYVRLGVRLSDTKLPVEEIEYVVNKHKEYKDAFKK